ncbi:hypothetical protein LLE87_30390, partial [Paenibacillus polymyxa]|nr:hypothetical protein [Paenibacillus polymyxa]
MRSALDVEWSDMLSSVQAEDWRTIQISVCSAIWIIINLNAEISRCRLQIGVAKERLHGAMILRVLVGVRLN